VSEERNTSHSFFKELQLEYKLSNPRSGAQSDRLLSCRHTAHASRKERMIRVGAKMLLRFALVNLLMSLAVIRSCECLPTLWTNERSLATVTGLVILAVEAASEGLPTNSAGMISLATFRSRTVEDLCEITHLWVICPHMPGSCQR
jgi:hypothetical protein